MAEGGLRWPRELGNNYWFFWFFRGFFGFFQDFLVFLGFFGFFLIFFFLFLRCYLFIMDTETLFNCSFCYINFSIVIKFQHVARYMYVTATHHGFQCNCVCDECKGLSTHPTNKVNNNNNTNNTNINNNNNINNNSFVDPVLNLNTPLQGPRNVNQLTNVCCFGCGKKLKVRKVKGEIWIREVCYFPFSSYLYSLLTYVFKVPYNQFL